MVAMIKLTPGPRTELSVTTSPFMEPDDYTWMKMTVVVLNPQAFYQWQGSVYHQLDDDLTLPLGGTPDDPAWSTTKVITQP